MGFLSVVSSIAACSGAMPDRPVVGAIRWDAWVGDASPVGLAVEKSLSPAHWHYRLPFYAKVLSANQVHVRGNTQDVMDREIGYASGAGLDYWAFVLYGPDDPMTRGGIDLYLSSKRKKEMHFCAIIEGAYLTGDGWPAFQNRLETYFRDPCYQTVCGDRPLLYILVPPDSDSARRAIDGLRKSCAAGTLPNPYIVTMEWSPGAGLEEIQHLGLDAVSSYCADGGKIGAPYADLANSTVQAWDYYAKTDPQVIPWVTTGWDRRPRIENPVFWEKPYGGGHYYAQPQPVELAKHLQDAISWDAAHPVQARAGAVIIYAWNEFDEGGWLCPTLRDADARLKALRAVLVQKSRPNATALSR
jgi:hypothetical protein